MPLLPSANYHSDRFSLYRLLRQISFGTSHVYLLSGSAAGSPDLRKKILVAVLVKDELGLLLGFAGLDVPAYKQRTCVAIFTLNQPNIVEVPAIRLDYVFPGR